jgi:hypothetical protein
VLKVSQLAAACAKVKLAGCPYCKRTEHMVGHGVAMGYAEASNERVIRGQRFCCGKRNRGDGCGRTTCIWLATTLPRRTLRTATLAALLTAGLDGASRHAGWRAARITTVTLRHLYRLWVHVNKAQPRLRTMLATCCAPPCLQTEPRPLAQMLAHLQHPHGPAPHPSVGCDVMANFALHFAQAVLT